MLDYDAHKSYLYERCQTVVRVNSQPGVYGVDDIIEQVFETVWYDMVSRLMELENGLKT